MGFDLSYPLQCLAKLLIPIGLIGQATDWTNTFYENSKGETLHAYLTYPPNFNSLKKYPAALVLHSWSGMSEEAVYFSDLLAQEGFIVLAPDLFRNVATSERNILWNIMTASLTPQERINDDVDAALEYLYTGIGGVDTSKVFSGPGFCFGGSQAINLSIRRPMAGTITLYGANIAELQDGSDDILWANLGAGGTSVLGIYGEEDDRPSPEDAMGFESALNARGISNTITIYSGVGHAFVNLEDHADGQAQAVAAWNQVVEFITVEAAAPPTTVPTVSPTVSGATSAPTPARPNNTGAPTAFRATSAPTGFRTTNAPTTSRFTSAPTVLNITSSPTVSNMTRAPTISNTTNAPTVSRFTSAPTVSNMTRAPTISNTTNTPTIFRFTSAPTVSNMTRAPTISNTTNAPTVSGFTSAPTTFGAFTIIVPFRIGYDFFGSVTPRAPTPEELNGVIVQTERFFSDVLQAAYPGMFESLSISNVEVAFDATADFPVALDMDVATIFSNIAQTFDEVFTVMQNANDRMYITGYVWESAPVGLTIFFEVQRVVFSSRGSTNAPTAAGSTNSPTAVGFTNAPTVPTV